MAKSMNNEPVEFTNFLIDAWRSSEEARESFKSNDMTYYKLEITEMIDAIKLASRNAENVEFHAMCKAVLNKANNFQSEMAITNMEIL